MFVGGVAIGAVVAAATTAGFMAGTRDTSARTPVTITATLPAAPTPPAPLPAAEANRQTCDTWVSTGTLINDAATALAALPPGTKILDPTVRANPDWSAAVQRAAEQYKLAGDKLASGIAPGTAAILDQTATSTAGALHALATADATYDAAGGNSYDILKVSANTMDVLCERLAPR
uniref:hypothetical protein n=1 Tax=Mycobacterium sp. MOTT-90 TaxID=1069227 RepID=UPI0018687126|nr:hypothetical protein [Mycobacterium sp. MOTT-90]